MSRHATPRHTTPRHTTPRHPARSLLEEELLKLLQRVLGVLDRVCDRALVLVDLIVVAALVRLVAEKVDLVEVLLEVSVCFRLALRFVSCVEEARSAATNRPTTGGELTSEDERSRSHSHTAASGARTALRQEPPQPQQQKKISPEAVSLVPSDREDVERDLAADGKVDLELKL